MIALYQQQSLPGKAVDGFFVQGLLGKQANGGLKHTGMPVPSNGTNRRRIGFPDGDSNHNCSGEGCVTNHSATPTNKES